MSVCSGMETRLTLRPGQHVTLKLVERFGERLVRVRYLYDAAAGRRLKTVELIVETVPGASARYGAHSKNCGNCAGPMYAVPASPRASSTPEALISSSHLPPYIPAHMYAGRCISPRIDGCIYIWMLLACVARRSINS
jgi:hypothetical protein